MDVIIGVDRHEGSHTAVAIGTTEQVLVSSGCGRAGQPTFMVRVAG